MLKNRTKKFSLMLTAVLMLGTAGCTSIYIPDESALQPMKPREAIGIITKAPHDKNSIERHYSTISLNGIGDVTGITVPGKRKLVFDGKNGKSVTYTLKDIVAKVDLYTDDFASIYSATVSLNSNELWGFTHNGGKQFADAVLVLKQAAIAEDKFEATFDKAAQAYRQAATKPEFTEAARKYKVQAEDAVSEKAFEDAADLYGEALNVAPWWPEGHFNRALVLSEIGDFETAVTEMNRYLLLVPEAPNVRAVQDKIYIWERKASKQN